MEFNAKELEMQMEEAIHVWCAKLKMHWPSGAPKKLPKKCFAEKALPRAFKFSSTAYALFCFQH